MSLRLPKDVFLTVLKTSLKHLLVKSKNIFNTSFRYVHCLRRQLFTYLDFVERDTDNLVGSNVDSHHTHAVFSRV